MSYQENVEPKICYNSDYSRPSLDDVTESDKTQRHFENDKDKLLACLLLYAGDEEYKNRVDSAFDYFKDYTSYVTEYSMYEVADKFLEDDTGKAVLQILYEFAKEEEY